MTVSIAEATSTTTTNSTTSSTSTSGSAAFSIEDFLSLLITEIKNQDPTNPMDSSDMVNQMVQMQTVSQMAEMTSSIESLTTANQQSSATSMIGKMVIYADNTSGSALAAQVEAVAYSGSSILLELASGDEIGMDDITYVYNTTDPAIVTSTNQKLTATSYLGKTVTYTDANDDSVEGVVESLIFDDTDIYLDLGTTSGSSVPLSDVTNVSAGG